MADEDAPDYLHEDEGAPFRKPCGEEGCDFVGKGKTAALAAMLTGSHKRVVHGIAGTGSAHRKKGPPTSSRAKKGQTSSSPSDVDPPGLAAIRDIADAVGKRNGAPTADDLAKGLGRGLGILSTAVASYAVETDETIPEGPDGDSQRDQLIDYLSFNDRQAVQVMTAPAKAFAPTKLNKRFGRKVVDNVDVAASAAEVGIMFAHWRRYFRSRRFREQQMGGAPPPAAVVIDANATPAPSQQPTSGPGRETQGVVVTAEMVQRMRESHG